MWHFVQCDIVIQCVSTHQFLFEKLKKKTISISSMLFSTICGSSWSSMSSCCSFFFNVLSDLTGQLAPPVDYFNKITPNIYFNSSGWKCTLVCFFLCWFSEILINIFGSKCGYRATKSIEREGQVDWITIGSLITANS